MKQNLPNPHRSSPGLTAAVYVMVVLGAALMLVPLTWMLLTSGKEFHELFLMPPRWFPARFRWANYIEALTIFNFTLYLRNSAFLAVMVILGTLISSSMAAYGLCCFNVKGKNLLFGVLLSTMMLPGQVTIIPIFELFVKLGWINTYYPLIVPAWLGTNVFAIFLLRQFFMGIPPDYLDAARIDGATEMRILTNIFMPLSKPVLLTVTVFTFIGSWNDLWGPVIFLHDDNLYTMPIGVLNFIALAGRPQGAPWHLVMAVSTVMMIPVIVVFFLAQKRFIEGISATGLKS